MLGKRARLNLFAAIFSVLAVSGMALFFNTYEPWHPVGPELIPDGSFSTPAATNAFSGWNDLTRLVPDGGFKGSPGVVLTTSSNRNGVLRFTVYNLTNIPAFRVSLRATAQGVVKGKEGYSLPRAVFFYQDTQAKSLFSLHHGILVIPKDRDWRCYKDYFPVPKGAANAQLHIQNRGVAGIMQADDISVIPIRERPDAPWWKLFFGTLWTVAFGLCLFALRPWDRCYGHLIMITVLLIITGIVLPRQILDGAVEETIRTAKSLTATPKPPPAQAVKAVAPVRPGEVKPAVPKEELAVSLTQRANEEAHRTGHLSLFSLLALLSTLSWLNAQSLRRAAAVYAGLTFFAVSTEVLQFITPDRSATLSDLVVDMSGMAGAVVLVFAIRRIQRLIRRD